MSETQRLLTALEQHGCKPERKAGGWQAFCPAHERDGGRHRRSLSLATADDGRALVHCHAGCPVDSVVAAVGLQMSDLMPDAPTPPSGKPRIVATYDYRDEAGKVLFQVVRYAPKDFRQRRPDGKGGWVWNVTGVRTIPYRLPELLAKPGQVVFVVEGEKDCNNLASVGLLATCNAGGAGKWTDEHAAFLRGRRVVVLPDNDEPGRRHAQQVARTLYGVAESVRILELPGLPVKGDVSDWLAAGGSAAELRRLAEAAPEWKPSPDPEPWPEIEPLDAVALPEFPAHVLPTPLRDWVLSESNATQTPADLPGMLALAVCAATIGRRVEVEPRPGWREPTNLFVAVLLEPGNRKSAVFRDATQPLRELEAELIEAARPTVAQEQSQRRRLESQLKRLEKMAAEGDAEAGYEADKLAAQLAGEPERVLPRLIVDDVTCERLGMLLAEQGGRIASLACEGGPFDVMAGLYAKNNAPQFNVYTLAHSGDTLITDRVGRKGVRVERPALTCGYAVQPIIFAELARHPVFRARGLLARFLYGVPQSWVGSRQIAPEPVPDAVQRAYCYTVKALFESCAPYDGEPFVLRLTLQAEAALRAWEAEIEGMLGDGGQMEMMRDWGGKLAGATLRLATVLHCVEHGPAGEIGEPTLASAVEIARYLIPHAQAVLGTLLAGDKTADDARYVLRWIDRCGLGEFTKRQLHRHAQRRFPQADDIDPALRELEKRGYIRLKPTTTSSPGRPSSPTYEVNPAVLESAESADKSDKTRRTPASAPPSSGNCVTFVNGFAPYHAPAAPENWEAVWGTTAAEVAINRLLSTLETDDSGWYGVGLDCPMEGSGSLVS